MTNKIKSHIALGTANLIYGINYSVAKSIMPIYSMPFGLNVIRVTGAIVLFWFFSFISRNNEKIEKKDFRILLLGGLFGVAFNQLLFLKGLNYTSSIDSSIITTLTPIFVLIIAYYIIKEKITLLKIFGIIIGAFGAALIILHCGAISFKSEHFLGNSMQLINIIFYAIFLVIMRPMMQKYHPLTVMKWIFLFGSFIIYPVGIHEFLLIKWTAIPVKIFIAMAYVTVAATFIAYLLNVYGLKYISTTTVSVYVYSQPVITSIIAIIFNHDTLSLLKIIAMLLVFCGVYLVSMPENMKRNIKNTPVYSFLLGILRLAIIPIRKK
jgi:drug/metabolite transporter (DMT)-like permease